MSKDCLSRLSVVIVTYFSEAHVDGVLGELPLDRLSQVVVVDNASTDGTRQAVASWGARGVRLVERESNDGFGAGCNEGVRAVDSELVLFLNPDARVGALDLERLVSYLDTHPDCAVAAPRLWQDGIPITSASEVATVRTELRFTLPQRIGRLFPERQHPPDRAVSGPVGMVEGACMLVRRQLFETVGGFDEAYFLFFEELDLAQRVRRVGQTVDLVATARAEHQPGASRAVRPWLGRDDYYASTVRYLWRWRGRSHATLYLTLSKMSWRLLSQSGRIDRQVTAAWAASASRTAAELRAQR